MLFNGAVLTVAGGELSEGCHSIHGGGVLGLSHRKAKVPIQPARIDAHYWPWRLVGQTFPCSYSLKRNRRVP